MADDSWWLDVSELDDEQQAAIDLPASGNYLVVGPPGSGKTNLLLLRAKYLSMSQRPNWVVLMFTRSLRDFVAMGSENYELDPEKILTTMKFFQRLLGENGFDTESLPKDFEARRLAVVSEMEKILTAKPGLSKHLECILVDEVQDCLPREVEIFFRLARNVFFVGDARQKVYRTEDVMSDLQKKMQVVTLHHHYRSGEKICIAADVIGKNYGEEPITPTCNYKEKRAPSSVQFEECSSDDEQVQKLVERLELQLRTYPGEMLAVSCPRSEDLAKLRASLEASSVSEFLIGDDEGVDAADDEVCVYLCSMHSLKGLEFRAVHLANMQGISKMRDAQKRLAFTGFTRAKTALSVYYVGKIPAYLEQAKEAISPKKPKPAVKSLFPGRK